MGRSIVFKIYIGETKKIKLIKLVGIFRKLFRMLKN